MGQKRSKAYRQAAEQYDKNNQYGLNDAVDLVKKNSFAKFDETINLDVSLGVDPRHADQMVRGTIVPPHGIGKSIRIVAIVPADREEEAKAAGADEVGADDLAEKVSGGWTDFDVCIAAPDMIGHLLPARYKEAKEAYRAAADALVAMAEASQAAGRHFVVTSDHGNIEDDTSAHSVNDVLTTIVRPDGAIAAIGIPEFQARLFDVAPTILELIGVSSTKPIPPSGDSGNFVGRPLVATQ